MIRDSCTVRKPIVTDGDQLGLRKEYGVYGRAGPGSEMHLPGEAQGSEMEFVRERTGIGSEIRAGKDRGSGVKPAPGRTGRLYTSDATGILSHP